VYKYLIAIVTGVSICAHAISLVVVISNALSVSSWPEASQNGVISNLNQLTFQILAIIASIAVLAQTHRSVWGIGTLKMDGIATLEVIVTSRRGVVNCGRVSKVFTKSIPTQYDN
jgi:hypothetical protein